MLYICSQDTYVLFITSTFQWHSVISISFHDNIKLKVRVPIHSLIPQLFSNIQRFCYQKLSHIQKAFCVKFYAQSRYSLGEIGEKPSWKLENVVSTIQKTISNISIVFSNCLQMRYIFAIFSPWMMFQQEKGPYLLV